MCVHAWTLEFDEHEGSSNTNPETLVPVDPRCAIWDKLLPLAGDTNNLTLTGHLRCECKCDVARNMAFPKGNVDHAQGCWRLCPFQ
jgi:hypothetical protein